MDVTFTYENVGDCVFGKIRRPIAKVTLKSYLENKLIDIWMIVDTGADHTILPKHFSDKLRISLEEDCIRDSTFGVGGGQSIYMCKKKLLAKIGNFSRKIPLAFFDNDEVPALLGRLGFLETFDVEFQKKFKVIFKN